MRAILIGAVLGAGLLAGCKEEPRDPLEAVAPNVIWEVVEIGGKPVPAGVEVTLTHPEKGLIAGASGCNRYNGRISEHEGRVRIGELAGTRMMCPDAMMQVEEDFRSNIARVDAVKIAADRLELVSDGKSVIVATQ
jgi:heat shock protein HslJ